MVKKIMTRKEFRSLGKRDFDNGAITDEIANALKLLEDVTAAASKHERCCDCWQDGLGGMHCLPCAQKTFAMFGEIQQLLGMNKSGIISP